MWFILKNNNKFTTFCCWQIPYGSPYGDICRACRLGLQKKLCWVLTKNCCHRGQEGDSEKKTNR